MSSASLLLLADGRFPAGGHAHSSGVEAACAAGAISDVATLGDFLGGRLHTAGRVEASFAVAARLGRVPLDVLDSALDARVPSPRLREVSRSLGRQAVRAGERIWPSARLVALRGGAPAAGPHQAIAYGVIADAAGLDARGAALVVLHGLSTAVATAAVRLLGLDPFAVHALLAARADEVDALAAQAVIDGACDADALPATSGPLVEILAEDHATWEVRLFAS